MMSRLGGLTRATDENVTALNALQDSMHRDTAAAEDLLATGRAAQKVAQALLKHLRKEMFSRSKMCVGLISCAGGCAGCRRATA